MDKQTISISRIGTDEAAQLAGLQAITFRQAYSDVHSSEDIEAYCAAQYSTETAAIDLSSRKVVCCVGQLESEPCGYYMVKHQACPIALDSESSELKQIYVLSSAYGSGLGQALYEHALVTIRAARHRWVWLCVSDINYRAQAFYEKHGFKRFGAGPVLEVGQDELPSSILTLKL